MVDPDTFDRLARRHFAWSNPHFSRSWEYPWVAEALEPRAGHVVLDAGAGRSPLPFWVAEQGATVHTVDHGGDNEAAAWGFFDFGAADPRIVSHNMDFSRLPWAEAAQFDRVVSVSVVEHMPAKARRAAWRELARVLKPGGRLVLTVDLFPDGKTLWNRCKGAVVEPPERHGTLDAMVAELRAAGFSLVRAEPCPVASETLRVAGLVLRRGPVPPVDAVIRRPVFIVGAMRSGTTLLADLLNRHPGLVHCPFELKAAWSQAGGVPMASPRTRDTTCPALDAADVQPEQRARLSDRLRREMARAARGKAGGAVLLNKNPHLCNKLPFVDALFPDARFVWVRRALPAVAASLDRLMADVQRRQQTWHVWPDRDGTGRARCWHAAFGDRPPTGLDPARVFPGGSIRHIAEYWIESNLEIARFVASLDPRRWVEVQEERLLADPDAVLRRCFEGLDLEPASVLRPEDALEPGRNDRWWRELSPGRLATLAEFVQTRRDAINQVEAAAADPAGVVALRAGTRPAPDLRDEGGDAWRRSMRAGGFGPPPNRG